MLEPRPPKTEESKELIEFLSHQLRPSIGWSIADEYPLALTSTNYHNLRFIRDDEKILSAAVMKPMIIKTLAGLFRVTAIGSVVTHPENRQQGLSHQVLESCIRSATESGSDFAILWTNLYDFYRKIGFELAGQEVSLALTANLPITASELRFELTSKVDPQAVLRLYAKHTCGVVRTAQDIRKFLSIPNSRVYTAWGTDNQLKAFLVEGKGADLQAYVHEWGGDVDSLISLLSFAQSKSDDILTLLAPSSAGNLVRRLESFGCKRFDGILGMIQILNPANFTLKIKKYFRTLGYEGVIFEHRDDQYYIGYDGEIFKTDSSADVVRLVFGPQKASELYPFQGEMKTAFEKVFPLPLWVWGWDSV
ncbi:MAG: GNAT family N-acetyltransferase [Bdellovibrionales bacterium]|nr:GNAT family N-acetyltransferase [Bdellovibrionales bacterium]